MFRQRKTHCECINIILPFIGIFIIMFMVGIAYSQNFIFLDKLIVSSLIIILALIMKILSDNSITRNDSNDLDQNSNN